VTFGDKIRVEPLDEARLANIERRIVARAGEAGARHDTGLPRGAVWAGALAALAASAVVGWKLRGDHTVRVASETAFAVTTGAEHSTLALDDATIDSGPDTKLAITHDDHRMVVAMTGGHVELAVAHHEDRIVLVRAGDTEIEDVGTRFAVDYAGAQAGGRVDVRVTEGEVKVTKAGRSTHVVAGAVWTNSEQPIVAMNTTAPAPVAVATSAYERAPTPPPTLTAVPPVIAFHGHRAEVPEVATSSHVATRTGKLSTSTDAGATSAEATRRSVATDPYVELALAIKRQPLEFDPNIDGVGDASAEIVRLKKVAYSPTTLGADASRALYRIAVLLHKPLKQDAEALRTLDVYRRRFSGGSEMHAATWLRVRIACERMIDDECRKAAYSYQLEVPVGPAAEIAIRITNAQ
jgi:hypothetical protein